MWFTGRMIWAGSVLAVLLVSAGRGLNGAAGYARATIEHSAKQVEQQLPHGVRDHKLANDLAAFKDEIVQRRARLNLASAEESRLQNLKAELESAIERRAVLLRDAAGAAELVADGTGVVVFAGREWSGQQFADELERLASEQELSQRQLDEQGQALVQLVAVLAEGRTVVGEMEELLRQSESEWQSLQLRREQADSRRQLLDLVDSAGRKGDSAAAEIGRHLASLRSEVAEAEATNLARGNLRGGQESELSRAARRQDLLQRARAVDAPVAEL